jgi:drug/metabolite transporter (DMT)-like permease
MRNWVLLLVLALLWAPSFLLIKLGLADIPPLAIVTLRLGIASAILYLLLRAFGGRLPRDRATWIRLGVMGFFGSALPFAVITLGEQFTDSAMAAILNGAAPIATALIAHFFISEERLSPGKLVGVVIGFGGIVTIFLPEAESGSASLLGMGCYLLAALCYGISIVHARKNLRGLPPLVGPVVQLGLGALMVLPATLLFESAHYRPVGSESFWSVLFLAVFGTAVAYIVYYKLVESASATFISLVTYFLPPAGIALGAWIRHERLAWNAYVGCALIIVGVVLVNTTAMIKARRQDNY